MRAAVIERGEDVFRGQKPHTIYSDEFTGERFEETRRTERTVQFAIDDHLQQYARSISSYQRILRRARQDMKRRRSVISILIQYK